MSRKRSIYDIDISATDVPIISSYVVKYDVDDGTGNAAKKGGYLVLRAVDGDYDMFLWDAQRNSHVYQFGVTEFASVNNIDPIPLMHDFCLVRVTIADSSMET